ncbi:DUF4956 domain-containing protein [Spirosoma koreense]
MILLQPISALADLPDLITSSGNLMIRLVLDVAAVGILIRLIYYRIYRRSDLFLMFFGFNFVIFLITYLLNHVQMSIGAAFGLLAVFSMLSYRTQGIPAKDMTYLFLVIAIGLITAISQSGWLPLILIYGLILTIVQLLEGNYLFKREASKSVLYDRIDHIRPDEQPALLAELQLRMGLPVHRVEIQHIDFRKEQVQLIVYYHPNLVRATQPTSQPAPIPLESAADMALSPTNPL